MNYIDHNRETYWNCFYQSRDSEKISLPSQFAAFVAQEASDDNFIIEIGCGNGRDSFFFARHGFNVLAIDGSSAAIERCSMLRDKHGPRNLAFTCASIGDEGFRKTVAQARAASSTPVMAYARFFLHAVTESEERSLLCDLGALLHTGDRVALEYRTIRDASGSKVTATHYRRFVEPSSVLAQANAAGFSVDYSTEGFGFAKYGADDAYVARCLLRKN